MESQKGVKIIFFTHGRFVMIWQHKIHLFGEMKLDLTKKLGITKHKQMYTSKVDCIIIGDPSLV